MHNLNTSKRIFLSPPHLSGEEMKYIEEAIQSNWIAPLGPNVDKFEREIADYVGVKGAVAVSSGTAAIHLALILLGVEKGDTVFCSTLTFVASANPILYQGATPVFIDSEADTWNMSPLALKKAFIDAEKKGKLPKAVIVVNLFGQVAKMNEIQTICSEYGVPVVEDAAESLGSEYRGKKSGSFGEFSIFSFNGNKIITTSGGGMLVSNNIEALERARFLSTQARDPAIHYQHSVMGFNYRLSNILAGIGRGQIKVIDERVEKKREIFQFYKNELAYIPGISFMPELDGTHSNRWLTAILIDEEVLGVSSRELIKKLNEENIESRPIWKPLHLQPLFKDCLFYTHNNGEEASSEKIFSSGVCLPSGTNMEKEEQKHVICCIKNVIL